MTAYRYTQFAQAYGTGTYNSCTYNCTTGTGTTTSTSPLANTGVAIAGIVTLACLIALVAILVRVWRRPASKAILAPEEAAGDEDDTTSSRQ